MNKYKLHILILSIFIANSVFGQVVVDFDEITNNTIYGTSYISADGLVFTIDGEGVSEFRGLDYIGQDSGNGIDIVIVSGAITQLTITRDGGGHFEFNSIYLQDGFGDANITVNGFNGITQTHTTSFDMFMLADVYNFNWSGVDKIVISSTDLSLAFDNATFTLNPPQFEDGLADGSDAISVDEGTSLSTLVYDVNANNGDGGSTDTDVTYSIISGNEDRDGDSSNAFEIDTNTGEISVADADDMELDPTEIFTLVIQANNGAIDNNISTATLTVTINDINDNIPVVTPNQEFSTVEHTTNSAIIGTLVATDPDISNAGFNWSIITNFNTDGDADEALVLDEVTGELRVNDSDDLDREIGESFTITVQVADDGNTNTSSPELVTIYLDDINDVLPVITPNQEFKIEENALNDALVGTVIATDGDVTATIFQDWTIISGNSEGALVIDPTTGSITVANQNVMDRELYESFILNITVSDGENISVAEVVTVVLSDVNDNPPIITSGLAFTALEGAATGTSIGLITANDADESPTLQDWTIVSGNIDNVFDLSSNSGEITVSGNGDIASQASYTLEVTVSDGLNTSDVQTVEIVINYKPVFSQDLYEVTIDDDSPIGSTLVVVEATDPEAAELTFSISSGNSENLFEIDASTGEILTAGLLDGEANPSYSLEISAMDDKSLTQIANVNVTVNHIEITGIGDIQEDLLKLYPNPSAGRFMIEVPDQTSYTLQVFDLGSNLVADLGEIKHREELNISSYPQGIYYLRIGFDEQVVVRKIVISK